MIEKNELERREWREIEPDVWVKTKFDSSITLNLITGEGKAIIYKSKYGKLELGFCINAFPGLSEIEVFCIRFILLKEG